MASAVASFEPVHPKAKINAAASFNRKVLRKIDVTAIAVWQLPSQ
jgi:hypothetical protein